MRVMDLSPGMQFDYWPLGEGTVTYIAQCPHPIFAGLQLVIWKLPDGTISWDAMSPIQKIVQELHAFPGGMRQLENNWRKAIGLPVVK
jgi:hypothetical protein